jgi:hypothetical protein
MVGLQLSDMTFTQEYSSHYSRIPSIQKFDNGIHHIKQEICRVGLRAGLSEIRVPVGARDFFHHRVHTDTGAHPGSYPMGIRGSFPGGKAAEP